MSNTHAGDTVEIAVIGGGAAGLSAALTLTRARRSVIVIDGGAPRNAPATAVHGLLGQEGVNPKALLQRGRDEIAEYGATLVDANVRHVSGSVAEGFTLDLDDGSTVVAGQLVVATGVVDDLSALPGLAARWGRDVVHCPYCHGWEIRDQRIGVLATQPMAALQATMFRQWTDRVTFFSNGHDFPAEQLDGLRALDVAIVPEPVRDIDVVDDRLTGVVLTDGTRVELDALAAPTRARARLDGLEGLGLATAENPMGTSLVADQNGHTSVPGVWGAGNVVNAGLQVSESVAQGARVAMTLNTELAFAAAKNAAESALEPVDDSAAETLPQPAR